MGYTTELCTRKHKINIGISNEFYRQDYTKYCRAGKRNLCNVLVAVIFFLSSVLQKTSACMGCVELDEISFDKMIAKFDYTLVKFDIAFPYGPKHEMFAEFARSVGPKVPELLVALVGVKDYGEKENSYLAQRYKIDDSNYPAIVLFQDNDNLKYVPFPKDMEVTMDNLKRFIRKNSRLHIPLDGCILTGDLVSKDFLYKERSEQLEIMSKLFNDIMRLPDEQTKQAEVYVQVMSKVMEKGIGFVRDERQRIEKLLKEKISEKKLKELTQKRNVLESFILEEDRYSIIEEDPDRMYDDYIAHGQRRTEL